MGVVDTISYTFYLGGVMSWDVLLTLANVVLFKRPVGKVTPSGHPGYGGYWPEYVPPREGDSRCSCPALNAMANHGIISRTGRGIKFTELTEKIRPTYNFSPSFCSFVPHYAARMLKKNYSRDTFDLEELDLHDGIEHDASLTRLDAALQSDQADKHAVYIEELLSSATGKHPEMGAILVNKDLSCIQGKRRAVAKAINKDYTLSLFHKMFGSANSSTMLTIFGGRVDDLRSVLLEERLPEGWESRVRKPFGLTFKHFNFTVLPVELGTRESDWAEAASKAVEERQAA